MEQQQQRKWEMPNMGISNRKKVVPEIREVTFQVRESINTLRANIQLSGYDLKVIAITSALPQEGKSSISFRLAKSMAALNKKTLYLDCDIRNSKTGFRYNIQEKTTGLTEFLCGTAWLNDIIYHTDDRFLDMIFTGAVSPNPSELLSNPLFEQLLLLMRDNYDYVIVDTPPVNSVIDGVLVAKHCDGTILMVESGITDRSQSLRAKKQLEYAGVKILGAVLNKVGTKKDGYGYGYGKRYAYGYSGEEGYQKKENE